MSPTDGTVADFSIARSARTLYGVTDPKSRVLPLPLLITLRTEPQSSSESGEDKAAEPAESRTSDSRSTGEPVPIEVWERTLAEVRRLSEELAAARERAARAEAEASFLREVLGSRSKAPTKPEPPRAGDEKSGSFDLPDQPSVQPEDPEAEEQRQEELRKAIAAQLRSYTEQRSQERRRPWKRS